MYKWGRVASPRCQSSNNPQTLGHVMGSCNVHLNEGRYNYRHNSVLLNLVKSITETEGIVIYADLEGYKNPGIVTGDEYRPDLVVIKDTKEVFLVELTVGFETNIEKNSENKANRYENLLETLKLSFEKVAYVNLSMGALGIYGKSCHNFKKNLVNLGQNASEIDYNLYKITNVCIRTSYFLFCSRNKIWSNPDLLIW